MLIQYLYFNLLKLSVWYVLLRGMNWFSLSDRRSQHLVMSSVLFVVGGTRDYYIVQTSCLEVCIVRQWRHFCRSSRWPDQSQLSGCPPRPLAWSAQRRNLPWSIRLNHKNSHTCLSSSYHKLVAFTSAHVYV